jgi:probable F420-dependent oxidoreductase
VGDVELGSVGVWWSGSWRVEGAPDVDAAAEVEAIGYGAIWSSGGFEPGLSPHLGRLLASTRRIVVASGIVSIWVTPPDELAAAVHALDATYPDRFLLGLGVSHAPLTPDYAAPYQRMVHYLDALDAATPSVPTERRVLAALRPRLLTLAAHRSAGAHPYLVPVAHTARARSVLGPRPLLAPELTAVIDSDPDVARPVARTFVAGYLALPNYANNLRSLGFDDIDLAEGGSDRLLDAVVAWGDVDAVARRVREHLDAGADHVCVQLVTGARGFPLDQYRALGNAVFGSGAD